MNYPKLSKRVSVAAVMVLACACDGMVDDPPDDVAGTNAALSFNDDQMSQRDPNLRLVSSGSVCQTRSTSVVWAPSSSIFWEDFFGYDPNSWSYLLGRCRSHKVAGINNSPTSASTNKYMSYEGIATFPQFTTGYLTGAALANAIDTCEAAYMLFDGYEHDQDGDPTGDHFISEVVPAKAKLSWSSGNVAAKITSCMASSQKLVASWTVDSVEMVVWGISLDTSNTRVASRVRWLDPTFW